MKKNLLLLTILLLPFLLLAQTVQTLASGVGIDDALVLDAEGNLYGANYDGSAVFKLTPDGTTSIFANGFDSPNGLAFDSEGILYMADNTGNQLYRIYPDGTVESFIDNFFNPSGIIFAEGTDTLIVTSYMGNKLVKIAPDSSAQNYSSGLGYNGPVGMCYDDDGNLYVANFNDRLIFKLNEQGAPIFFAQPPGSGAIGFITYANGYIYATLFNDHKIYRIDLDGNVELFLGSSVGSIDGNADVAKFNRPNGILASPTGDSLYVSDYGSKSVRLITNLEGTTKVTELAKKQLQLKLTPNPVVDRAFLNFELTENQLVEVNLLDQLGKKLRQLVPATRLGAGKHQLTLDLAALSSGVYYCQVAIGQDQRLVKKMVLVR